MHLDDRVIAVQGEFRDEKKIHYIIQGLKNPLVWGPGPAICGFGPNIF